MCCMFLKTKHGGSLVEVLAMDQLVNSFEMSLQGRLHAGEELQDPEPFAKERIKNDPVFAEGLPTWRG